MKGWPNDQAGPGEINSPTHFAGAAGRSSVDDHGEGTTLDNPVLYQREVRPVDPVLDALNRLEKLIPPPHAAMNRMEYLRTQALIATVRDYIQRLREERDAWRDWIDKPHKEDRWQEVLLALPSEYQHIENPVEKLISRAEAAEAEVQRLREERDTTTPLHALREKNRELRASLEAAEAENQRLREERDEAWGDLDVVTAEVQRLTEGLRRIDNWPVDVMVGPATDLRRIKDYARVLLTDSPPDGETIAVDETGVLPSGRHISVFDTEETDGGGAK